MNLDAMQTHSSDHFQVLIEGRENLAMNTFGRWWGCWALCGTNLQTKHVVTCLADVRS